MMGPEEVLIRGGNVSVNGQLVPDGESRLLPGKGQSACPRVGLRRAAESSWALPPAALGSQLRSQRLLTSPPPHPCNSPALVPSQCDLGQIPPLNCLTSLSLGFPTCLPQCVSCY